MAEPAPFFNIGLPQLPLNVDPKIEPDLRDLFNAVRNLSRLIGQYGGYESAYDGYKSVSQVLYTAGAYKRRVYVVANEAITYGNTVHFVNTAGNLTAEKADATAGLPCLGICNTPGTCAIGATIEVVLAGAYVTSIGSLTPGLIYYQHTVPGVISSGAPATNIQPLGFALDEEVFYFFPCCMEASGGGGGTGDVVGPASSVNNRVVFFDGVTGKLIKDSGLTLSGSNTGDQTLAGLGGQPLDADLTTLAGLSATANDVIIGNAVAGFAAATLAANQFFARSSAGAAAQKSITDFGLSLVDDANAAAGRTTLELTTKAQFDAACTDGNFLYVGDVTQYTDELAQDAVGAMVDASLVYVDATPLLQRAALTGHITAAAGSNATVLGSFTKAQLDAAVSDGNVVYTDAIGVSVQAFDADLSTLAGMAATASDIVVGNAVSGFGTIALAANTFPARSSAGAAGAKSITDAILTFLATPNSANLLAAVTDETGTGLLVFGTNPVLTTPTLTSPLVSTGAFYRTQAAPASKAAAATLTNTELLAGLIQYTGAAANLTLPTGTLMDTGASAQRTLAVDMSFDFHIINTSAATVTLVAGATFTIVGTATTLTGISSQWRCRRTAANTWVAYRV